MLWPSVLYNDVTLKILWSTFWVVTMGNAHTLERFFFKFIKQEKIPGKPKLNRSKSKRLPK